MQEDVGVGWFCTSVATTAGAELFPGELWGRHRQGRAAGAGAWQGLTSASSKGRIQAGVCGTLSPPARSGRQREGERTAGNTAQHAPAKAPIEAYPWGSAK